MNKGLKKLGFDKANVKKAAPQMAGAFVGGAAGGVITKGLTNLIPEKYRTETIVNSAPLVLGIVLGVQKNEFLHGAGLGLIGVAAQKYGAQLGLGDIYLGDVPEYIEIEGIEDGNKTMLGNPGQELGY